VSVVRRDHLLFLTELLAERAGQTLAPDRLFVIESRLSPLARREGFASVAALVEAIKGGAEPRLAQAAAEALVDPESSFFRDRAPFAQFRDLILPAMARARSGKPVRVWSAGCGTGQEAYSLAIAAEHAETRTPGMSVELTATDFAEAALEKARAGLYTHFEVQRGLPIRQLVEHFERADDLWRASPRLRTRLRWGRVNHAAELPEIGRFDVVFCRYMLKDFEPGRRIAALQSLARCITPGGVLIMGEGESPLDIGAAFRQPTGARGLFQRVAAEAA